MSGKKPSGQHLDKRLTAAKIRALSEPGFYADGHALYLKVEKSGAKRWIQRLVIQGKRRDLGLGSASLVSLAEAREAALENRKSARAGNDPLAAKKALYAVPTFEEAAGKVHAANLPTWRNAKHGNQWLNTLKTYAFPAFGKKRVSEISSADIMKALGDIWTVKPETARRVKQRIGTVLKWAVATGWRTDNPADFVQQGLAKQDRSKVVHRKAVPYDAVSDAITKVQGSSASLATKLAFEFLILTATRSGETRLATWGEIDLAKEEWTIPASRMKAKKPHRVPLSNRCIAILKEAEHSKQRIANWSFPAPSRQSRYRT